MTIYESLAAKLRKDILSGRYAPGEMVSTEGALAAEARISRTSVRSAIDNLVREGLVERRVGKGVYALRAPPGTTIVELVVPNLSGLWEQVANGAQDTGAENGVKLQIYNANRILEADLGMIRALPSSGTNGAIIGALHRMRMNEALVDLWRQGFPFVLADQRMNDIEIPSVIFDNHQAGYLATQQLLRLGHRRIAFVGHRIQMPGGGRADGYRDAIADAGLPFDRSLERIVPLDPSLGDKPLSFLEATQFLLEQPAPPSALVFHNENMAASAYPLLKRLGVRIPDDISVVGIGDDGQAEILDPPLAAIALPGREMGAAAMDILMRRLKDPTSPIEHRVLPVRWVVRESVTGRRE
ncbi:MAG: GntR family transcriptional regulator [Kiritimatiellae bacterium]|nr:GntR family transcriptional regulator [Kiritimatiellia bacterium]